MDNRKKDNESQILYGDVSKIVDTIIDIKTSAVLNILVGIVLLFVGLSAPSSDVRGFLAYISDPFWNGIVIICLSFSMVLKYRIGGILLLLCLVLMFIIHFNYWISFWKVLLFIVWCAIVVIGSLGTFNYHKIRKKNPNINLKSNNFSIRYFFKWRQRYKLNFRSIGFLILSVISIYALIVFLKNLSVKGPTSYGILLIILVSIFAFWDLAKRSAILNASRVLENDKRPFFLLLRSFEDEEITVANESIDIFDIIKRHGVHKQRFEIILEQCLRLLGPSVALGYSGDWLPPLGAIRDYTPDEKWQKKIVQLIKQSRQVFLILGKTQGLLWEFNKIFEIGALEKLTIILPPIKNIDNQERWDFFVNNIRDSDIANLMTKIDIRNTILIRFNKHKQIIVIKSKKRKKEFYYEAIKCTVQNKKWQNQQESIYHLNIDADPEILVQQVFTSLSSRPDVVLRFICFSDADPILISNIFWRLTGLKEDDYGQKLKVAKSNLCDIIIKNSQKYRVKRIKYITNILEEIINGRSKEYKTITLLINDFNYGVLNSIQQCLSKKCSTLVWKWDSTKGVIENFELK